MYGHDELLHRLFSFAGELNYLHYTKQKLVINENLLNEENYLDMSRSFLFSSNLYLPIMMRIPSYFMINICHIFKKHYIFQINKI